jgi:hypothetical protein
MMIKSNSQGNGSYANGGPPKWIRQLGWHLAQIKQDESHQLNQH